VSSGVGATAIGVNAQSTGDTSVSIGNLTKSQMVNSIAIGDKSFVGLGGTNGIAIGLQNTVTGSGAVALGNTNTVTGANSFAFGSGITAAGSNAIVLGSGSDGSRSNAVSVGAAGAERQIVNVAAGTKNTDAVNLGQMNQAIAQAGSGPNLVTQDATSGDILVAGGTNGSHVNFAGASGPRELTGVAAGTTANSASTIGQLTPVVAALGGGAGIDPTTGKVTGPTYNIQGQTTHDVGSALTTLDSGINNLKDEMNAGGIGLVTQDATTRDINVGASTDGGVVNVAGTAGNRKITGVANGDVTSSSVDAINGSQLAGLSSIVATAIGGGSMMNSDGSIS
jgi:autotransporter adhesin